MTTATFNPRPLTTLRRFVAVASLAAMTGLTFCIATATISQAVTYCQAVCKDRASAACFERCNGNDQQRSRAQQSTPPTRVDKPVEVARDAKQPDWIISVFDPKGGGGNGGGAGGGNGR